MKVGSWKSRTAAKFLKSRLRERNYYVISVIIFENEIFTELVPTGFDPAAVREVRKSQGFTEKSGGKGGSHLGAAQALSCHMVGFCGHIYVEIFTMITTMTKLYHPYSAAPLLALQTMLTVPAFF